MNSRSFKITIVLQYAWQQFSKCLGQKSNDLLVSTHTSSKLVAPSSILRAFKVEQVVPSYVNPAHPGLSMHTLAHSIRVFGWVVVLITFFEETLFLAYNLVSMQIENPTIVKKTKEANCFCMLSTQSRNKDCNIPQQ